MKLIVQCSNNPAAHSFVQLFGPVQGSRTENGPYEDALE